MFIQCYGTHPLCTENLRGLFAGNWKMPLITYLTIEWPLKLVKNVSNNKVYYNKSINNFPSNKKEMKAHYLIYLECTLKITGNKTQSVINFTLAA